MDVKFCECGRLAINEREGKMWCDRHFKKPLKPKRKKGVLFSGNSKWREEEGFFQARDGR